MTTALNPLETVANARAALHEVVSRLTEADNDKQTPNAKFTVAQLTDHLQNSIKLLGGAAGVDIALTTEGSVADRLLPQSQAVVDAWQRRGIDGTVTLPIGEYPAEVAVRVLGSGVSGPRLGLRGCHRSGVRADGRTHRWRPGIGADDHPAGATRRRLLRRRSAGA